MYDNGGGNFRTAAEYYSYNSPFGAAANTPDNLERSNTATMFLYDDPGNGLSLFHIYDRANDGDGFTASVSITSTGLAGFFQTFLVKDDPGDDTFVWNSATGSANLDFVSSPCCTDGWVLGLLPDVSSVSWTVNAAFTSRSGITNFDIVTLADPFGTGPRVVQRFSIAANEINSLEFVRSAESVEVSESAALIFPMAALCLIAVRRRRA